MESSYNRWTCTPKDLVGLDGARARDLIVECFFQAQHEAMSRNHATLGLSDDDGTIRMEAEGAVRNAFKRTGGDFGAPDRVSLGRAVESLAASASAMGTPVDIIEHHKRQIGMVLAGLPE